MLTIVILENTDIVLAEVRSSKLMHIADTKPPSSRSFLKRVFCLAPILLSGTR